MMRSGVLCACGCGEETNVRYGRPNRYIHNHHRLLSPTPYIVDESGCWIWQRSTDTRGYGCLRDPDGRTVLAHRFYYREKYGEIPAGHELHHTCSQPRCVNPAHLEPVTPKEQARRHAAADPERTRRKALAAQATRRAMRMFEWSMEHPACAECGTTERAHVAHGLCRRCYKLSRACHAEVAR